MDIESNRRPEDNLAILVWHARPDTSCEYVNRAWLDYTGYTLEQALGEAWVRCLHPEDLARWLDACVQAFDERRELEVEYRLRRRDGAYRWFLERAAPRFAGDGLFLGYAGACVDVDEYKRVEQALSRALERERRLRILTEKSIARAVLKNAPLLSGVRVLVVDKGEGIVAPLEAAGAEVRLAASTQEALRTLGGWRPDVVLSGEDHAFIRALRAVARLAA